MYRAANTVVIHLAREAAVQEPADLLRQERRERVERWPPLLLEDHPAVQARLADLGAAEGMSGVSLPTLGSRRCASPRRHSWRP